MKKYKIFFIVFLLIIITSIGIVAYSIDIKYDDERPTLDAPKTQKIIVQAEDSIKPNYLLGEEHDFYIDSCGKKMLCSTSRHLLKAVQDGYKPRFLKTKKGQLIKQIYDNTRDALTSIINNRMTDYEKVKAIYQWIIYNVRYDKDLIETEKTNWNKYYGAYLEGIFLDRFYKNDMHAVCAGYSKAFVLMCAIEGIPALYVTGEIDGYDNGHAWNKVYLDADGDGTKEWYAVDVTWGDKTRNGYEAYLTYDYFLISDDDFKGTRHENEQFNYPKATGSIKNKKI